MAQILLPESTPTKSGGEQLYTVATVVKVKDLGEGKYEITEIASDEASFPDLHSGNRKQFSFPLPIPGLNIVGYVDEGDQEIGLYVTFAGSQVGPKYTASLTQGVSASINLLAAGGGFRVYVSGNQVKIDYNLWAGVWPFKKEFNDSAVIITL